MTTWRCVPGVLIQASQLLSVIGVGVDPGRFPLCPGRGRIDEEHDTVQILVNQGIEAVEGRDGVVAVNTVGLCGPACGCQRGRGAKEKPHCRNGRDEGLGRAAAEARGDGHSSFIELGRRFPERNVPDWTNGPRVDEWPRVDQ